MAKKPSKAPKVYFDKDRGIVSSRPIPKPPRRRNPKELGAFKVTLTRLKKGESAIPTDHRKANGLRTKLGGEPDWIQNDGTPNCADCGKPMTFVAQIDSIEHIAMHNPFGIDFKNPDRDDKKLGWMFGDVGMIYVFYCFNCGGQPAAVHQEY